MGYARYTLTTVLWFVISMTAVSQISTPPIYLPLIHFLKLRCWRRCLGSLCRYCTVYKSFVNQAEEASCDFSHTGDLILNSRDLRNWNKGRDHTPPHSTFLPKPEQFMFQLLLKTNINSTIVDQELCSLDLGCGVDVSTKGGRIDAQIY